MMNAIQLIFIWYINWCGWCGKIREWLDGWTMSLDPGWWNWQNDRDDYVRVMRMWSMCPWLNGRSHACKYALTTSQGMIPWVFLSSTELWISSNPASETCFSSYPATEAPAFQNSQGWGTKTGIITKGLHHCVAQTLFSHPNPSGLEETILRFKSSADL